ncbi:A24 family peptidase [Sphingomonas sp.]|uniref:prepilin peptidase n=1 Tax=Sphingomonas sp. TaxID=28214 RepID=UPI0025E00572|nr:A24 family peptidase [Sphingomonas sp.]
MSGPIWWVLAGTALGAILGSFIATLVIRWPQGRGTGGRSACDGCAVRLRWFELVPLASFLLQRGKCRHCGARIAPDHFWIEAVCVVVGGVALAVAPGWEGMAGACFGWILVALAALDLRHFWLPDRLTLALAATGVAGGAIGFDPPLSDRLVGGLAGFATLSIIAWSYKRLRGQQGMGAGDPKLLGAIGLWLGWQVMPFVLLGASILGINLVVYQLLRKRIVTSQTRLPLGALMAVAAFPIWVFSR